MICGVSWGIDTSTFWSSTFYPFDEVDWTRTFCLFRIWLSVFAAFPVKVELPRDPRIFFTSHLLTFWGGFSEQTWLYRAVLLTSSKSWCLSNFWVWLKLSPGGCCTAWESNLFGTLGCISKEPPDESTLINGLCSSILTTCRFKAFLDPRTDFATGALRGAEFAFSEFSSSPKFLSSASSRFSALWGLLLYA